MNITAEEILNFWYSDRLKARWFSSTPQLDREIQEKYEAVWKAACNGQLDNWQETPDGSLALVIVLDQLPLNMFRGQAKGFSSERLAVAAALAAINKNFDQHIGRDRIAFLYMPLMHSENLAEQDLSVKLFSATQLSATLRFAEHHREIIRQFGRFPHRNQILGRTSTEQEIQYLASAHAFKG